MRFARQRRSWRASRRDTLAAGGQRRSSNLVVTAETALDAEPGTHRLAAGLVGAGGAARGANDARDADTVRDHKPGDRQPADGDIRCVRLLRDAGARHLRRRMARQAGRARRAGAGRKRAADDRHAVSSSTLLAAIVTVPVAFTVFFAGVIGPNAASGAIAALLPYVLPAASPGTVSMVPDRLAGWCWLRSSVPPRCCCCRRRAPATGSSAQPPSWPPNWCPSSRRCCAASSSRAAGGLHRGQARPPGAVHGNAVPADRAWWRRPGPRQRGRAARMVHVAGSRQRERAQRPVRCARGRARATGGCRGGVARRGDPARRR